MIYSVAVCLLSLCALIWILRAVKVSLGLPIAYLMALLIIHVPGAFIYIMSGDLLWHGEFVAIGIYFTAIASACFVAGVTWSRFHEPKMPAMRNNDYPLFWRFCAIGGWVFIFLFATVHRIPSLAAIVDKGSGIWMLGALLGLRAALQRFNLKRFAVWSSIAGAFPAMTLLLTGFLSRATTSTFIVVCGSMITAKSYTRVLIALVIGTVVFMNLFLNYFLLRDKFRESVQSGVTIEQRFDEVVAALQNFQIFNPRDLQHLAAFDERLNQNYFEGLAAIRIEQGSVNYLYGRSIWQAFLSLIPRAIWPGKPIYGGSPEIVATMTGLRLSTTTSWGVGHVMELQINFGIPGLVIGFFVIGWLLGALDREAAYAELRSNYARTIMFFMPAVGLIFPEGSLVEMSGGAAAGLVSAFFWCWVFKLWSVRLSANTMPALRP